MGIARRLAAILILLLALPRGEALAADQAILYGYGAPFENAGFVRLLTSAIDWPPILATACINSDSGAYLAVGSPTRMIAFGPKAAQGSYDSERYAMSTSQAALDFYFDSDAVLPALLLAKDLGELKYLSVNAKPSSGGVAEMLRSAAQSDTPALVLQVGTPVPDLRGMLTSDVKQKYGALRLRLTPSRRQDNAPAGTILDQKPKPPALLLCDRGISVAVSTGPAPPPKLVPNLAGMTAADAQGKYAGLGLKPSIAGQRQSATVGSGVILDQAPQAGAPMPADGVVQVWVSSGPPPKLVPNLAGMTAADAKGKFADLGLKPTVAGQRQSSSVGRGLILAQAPQAGTPMPADGVVQVWLSSGPPPPAKLVPKLLGLTPADAEQKFAALGLKARIADRRQSPTVALGLILDQKPAAGTPMPTDGAIDVWVSSGPPPAAAVLPDLRGLTQALAAAKVLPLELKLAVTGQQASDNLAAGLILDQNPPPGSPVPADRVVQLTLSSGPPASGPLQPFLWGFGAAAVLGAIGLLAARLFRRTPPTPPPAVSLSVVARPDRGLQKPSHEGRVLRWSLALRATRDPGKQTVKLKVKEPA